jgi:hypothetical protein
LKPLIWKRFVDDTNVLWSHWKEELEQFFKHLNDISTHMKFTMELEDKRSIPFLDMLIKRKQYGNLGHAVHRKNTHTKNYLHASSHHHPTQKIGVLNTLATRAIRIFYEDHLDHEKDHLSNIFKSIGYKENFIKNAMKKSIERKRNRPQSMNNYLPGMTTYRPCIQGATNNISRVLSKKETKTSFIS